jgi:glycosidase
MSRTAVIAAALLFTGCSPSRPADHVASDPGEFVPRWAKSAVWYQVFPERFRNGDPSNDPTARDLSGADPQQAPVAWQVHPWGSDWYRLQPWEKENGEAPLWQHLLRRRYGGDLQGIIDRLDYLDSLGVNAVYLNPVFDSPSLHKYDAASYHHVDPNFGPDPDGDRAMIAGENPLDPSTWVWTSADRLALELIDEVHRRGMRIIFDGVFNHMGRNSFAFRDLVEKQQDSPYADWFVVRSWDDPAAGTRFEYSGWAGVRSLPEFREDGNGIVEGPSAYIFAATERWMNPGGRGAEHGIDGWRLDVAYDVSHAFWKRWRTFVRSINPEAYLTAEIVRPPEAVLPYLQGDEFDGEMSYNFAFTASEFLFEPEPTRISPSEFDRKLERLRTIYPPGVAYVVQNLFGSHDANRIGSHIVNRGIGTYRDWPRYFGLSKATDNPEYDVRKPRPDEIRLQKLFVILQMTVVGAPMIYYGDEVGMWGANDPDCRKPMVWGDLEYAPEATKPDGTPRPPDPVGVDSDLLAHYRRLIAMRREHPALQVGAYRTLVADDSTGLFAFERTEGDDRVIVVLNPTPREQPFPFTGSCMEDLVAGTRSEASRQAVVPGIGGLVLVPCGSG